MVIYHNSSHPIVCVARILVYPMPLATHTVHFQSFSIMKLGANLMSEVTYNVQLEPQLHPLSGESLRYHSAIRDDDTRVDIRASSFWRCLHIIPFLMLGFSTALQPLIILHWPLFFGSMNWRNVVLMRSIFGRWSMEVLPQLLPPLTNILLACSVGSGVLHILWWWADSVVVWGSLCCVLQ